MKMGPAKKNALFGYMNFFVSALLAIITTPLLVSYLGPTVYGTWKALQRLIEVAALFDGKPYQALKSLLAGISHSATHDERSRTIGSSIVVWILWLPILVSVLAAAASIVAIAIKDANLIGIREVQLAGWLLAVNALLLTIVNIPGAVLIAINNGYIFSIATLFSVLIGNIGIVYVVYSGHGLIAMSLITCGSTVLLGLITLLVVRQRVKWWKPHRPTRDQIRSFAKYGAWINGWSIVANLLFATETLMLAVFVGSEAVTTYSISAFAMQFAAAIALITASALVPSIGTALGAKCHVEASKLITIARELVLTVATMAAGMNLIANEVFVATWIGPEYFIGFTANVCISLAVYQIVLIRCEAQLLESGLTIRRPVYFGLASSVFAALLGSAAYMITDSITGLLIGLVIGRLGLTVALPLMTNNLQSMELKFPLRSLLASVCMLGLALALAVYLAETANLGLKILCLVVFCISAAVIVPSHRTLRTTLGRVSSP